MGKGGQVSRPLQHAQRASASFSDFTDINPPYYGRVQMTSLACPEGGSAVSDPALGLSAPHHSTLPQSLPGPCLGPSRPTLPSPDLVPASAPQGGTPQVRHSVSFQLVQCTPSPLWLPGSCLLPGGCPPPPGPVQAAVRWLCGEPTLAWPDASSALYLGWFPGSTFSQLGCFPSLGLSLLFCTMG